MVAYDAAAHGQSGRLPPDFELSHFADEIDAVGDAVGLTEPVLVGHSMGGANALRRAARGDGIRGVLTVDGAIVASGGHHYSSESPEAYRVVLWQAGRRAADTVAIYDRIECPTLLLCAERWKPLYGGTVEETKELLADVARRRPNVEVEWLDAGHSLHWELPDVVEERIRDFARRLA